MPLASVLQRTKDATTSPHQLVVLLGVRGHCHHDLVQLDFVGSMSSGNSWNSFMCVNFARLESQAAWPFLSLASLSSLLVPFQFLMMVLASFARFCCDSVAWVTSFKIAGGIWPSASLATSPSWYFHDQEACLKASASNLACSLLTFFLLKRDCSSCRPVSTPLEKVVKA